MRGCTFFLIFAAMDDWRYIKVILPLKLAWEPFYRIPADTAVCVGSRVRVIFAGRMYVAVVVLIDAVPDVDLSRVREISGVEEHLDIIGEKELALWHFISDYYLCTIGEVYKLAYPAVKTAGEETAANAILRRELRMAREAESLARKIERLKERLAGKDKAMLKKHGDKVTAQLAADRERIVRELEALQSVDATQEVAASTDNWSGQLLPAGLPSPGAAETAEGIAAGKTVLIRGGGQRAGIELEMIHSVLSQGRDVLFLVPDIKLARKLRDLLRLSFGDFLHVVHSEESAAKRRETAALLRLNLPGSGRKPTLVLGTRSALFFPYQNLGLVIVEEEHDYSYKQETAPRYNIRDTAVLLGSLHSAGVILASPTPSLESLLNCMSGKYLCVRVPSSGMVMEVIDTTVERKKNGMVGSLSRKLMVHIDDTLTAGGRVLLLRPWGPLDELEEEVAGRWPLALSEGRMAVMTTFDAKRADLSGISLLGIVNAEAMLGKQDFRADERAVQTLEQLRSRLDGLMVVQTRQGGHQVFTRGAEISDILLAERKLVNYPPYTRMLDIIVRDSNESRLELLSSALSGILTEWHPIGPYAPLKGNNPVEATRHIRVILPRNASLGANKKKIAGIVGDFEQSRKYPGHIILDVDPV